MRELLEQKLDRFEELERQILDPAVQANSARMSAVAREHGSLAKVATKYRRFKDLNRQIAAALEMIEGADAELRELAEAELPELKAQREALWTELLDLTIGGEDANRSRCVMEIRAGTGGDEAALFARDLYEMYKHYAEDRRWKVEVLEHQPDRTGRVQGNHPGHRRAKAAIASCTTRAAAIACSACPKPRPRAASTPRPPPWP